MYIKGINSDSDTINCIFLLAGLVIHQKANIIRFNSENAIHNSVYMFFFPSEAKAMEAMDFIGLGIRQGDRIVDLTDLQQ